MRRQQRRGFTLIELMVSSAVTFVTVLAVSAAFLGYTQSFYTQAGIRGGQASLRQTHLMVVRNLRMAGYGIEPSLAFDFPDGRWQRSDSPVDDGGWFSVNRSDRLIFRMRNPAFNAFASTVSETGITLARPLRRALRKGQILQVMCPGAIKWTYVQLSADAPAASTSLLLEGKTGIFPRVSDFNPSCYGSAGGLGINVFKIDVYDYSVRLIDDDGNPLSPGRPYLFRRHGLDEKDPANAYGEPVAEDIEAMRVTFVRGDGTAFIPDPKAPAPEYGTSDNSNSPANIRAVVLGLVARSSTRDSGASESAMNQIPSFGRNPTDGTAEPALTKDTLTKKALPHGFRRVVSEMSIQVRNMRSSKMPFPLYTLDTTTPDACKGAQPNDDFNCAGG